jgi:hypothetical protein
LKRGIGIFDQLRNAKAQHVWRGARIFGKGQQNEVSREKELPKMQQLCMMQWGSQF